MTQHVIITLPWPPSVNHYWLVLRKGSMAGRVIISTEGKDYRKAVAREVSAQRIPTNLLTGRLAVQIAANPPDNRTRDLDNLPKGVLDSLRHAGVFRDDCDIDDLHIRRGPIRKGGELRVTVSEIPGMATVSGCLFGHERATARDLGGCSP